MSPKSGEKISFAGRAIAAINPLPIGLRTKRALLFSEGYRLLSLTKTIFPVRPCPPAHMEDEEMRQVRSLLSSASSRIGRRLAQIVAIAAASLPAAGA